jgi:hypothetical protein
MFTSLSSTHPKNIKKITLGDGEISLNEMIAVSRYDAKVLYRNPVFPVYSIQTSFHSFSQSHCDNSFKPFVLDNID